MKLKLFACFAALAAASSIFTSAPVDAASPAAEAATLDAVPGKTTCRAATLNGQPGKSAELCVTQGSFAHDVYDVRIGGASVVKGIDDATTAGIASTYDGQPIRLTCTPVLSKPDDVTDAQIESMRFANPKGTHEELKRLYVTLHTVETGRHCAINDNAAELFAVDVRFQ
jgi:hypothetical protein